MQQNNIDLFYISSYVKSNFILNFSVCLQRILKIFSCLLQVWRKLVFSFMRNTMQKKAVIMAVMIFLILLYFLSNDSMVDLGRNKYSKRSSKYATNLNYFNLISYDINYIMKNPIYANFSIKPNQFRKRVNLLVIVTSAPRRIDRRNAIRDTWWKSCQNNTKVYA